MNTKSSKKKLLGFLIAVFLIVTNMVNPSLNNTNKAQAQSNPRFLLTPFYGDRSITSFFDHEVPKYEEQNNEFIRYDGMKWVGGVGKGSCLSGTNCYDGHPGVDIDLNYEPVLAAASGLVVDVGWDDDYDHWLDLGLYVEIEHTQENLKFRTRYGHLSSVGVHEDQNVDIGQIIGTSGSTGGSGGPHLHFDVRIQEFDGDIWRAIDPFGWQPVPGNPVQIDPWPG